MLEHFRVSPLCAALVAGTLLSLGVASGANAQTTSSSIGFSFGSLVIVDGGATFGQAQVDQTFQLPRFDPALGTLTGVTFNLVSALDLPLVSDLELFLVGYHETFSGPVHTFANSVFTTRISDPVSGVVFERVFLNDVECIGPGSALCTASDFEHAGEAYDDSVSPTPFSGYQGAGLYDVTVSQLIDLTVGPIAPNNGFEGSFNGRWTGSLEVVYSYSVVPPPPVPALGGAGQVVLILLLGGVASVRFMRRDGAGC